MPFFPYPIPPAVGVAVELVPPLAIATIPVTLLAVPVTLPAIGVVTVKLAKVPTLVKLDPVTVGLMTVPDKVFACAVTVIALLPSNATPLIFIGAANFVAVPALPVMVV